MTQSAVDLTRELIGFDTTSRGSNLALIDYAQSLLEKAGARCRRSYDAGGTKANLFATFGPEGDGGYVLSGHTDVVPVDGQNWSSDPFKAEIRDGLLYGRGSCDMKGFLGTALSLLPEISRAKLKRPLHFALSYDEEVGCLGVKEMLDDLAKAGIKPALALIGEPTSMKVVGAHKAGAVIHTHCCGREAHSSKPHLGANAVMMAGEFVHLIEAKASELQAITDANFDPPYSTVQANMIDGGSAVNILAKDAVVTWEYRVLPDKDPTAILKDIELRAARDILPKYQARAKEARFETVLHATYPGLALNADSPAVALARELSGMNAVEAVAYGTEAGYFQKAGIPAVVCGPGSIDQAHSTDEFVPVHELAACEAFLKKVIAKAAN